MADNWVRSKLTLLSELVMDTKVHPIECPRRSWYLICGVVFKRHNGKCIYIIFKHQKKLLIFTILFQSFGVAWIVGSLPLFWALFVSFILGTAYSINVSLFSFMNLPIFSELELWGCLMNFLPWSSITRNL